MGWFKVDQVAARGRHSGTLSCALMKNSSKNGAIRLRVRLSRDVQQAAGLTGGDTLDLEWGEDELAGRVLLKKAGGDAGVSRLRWQHPKSRAAVETGFSALPDGWFPGAGGRPTFLGLTVRPAASCPWKIEGAALEVTLPEAWFSAPPDGARPVSRLKGAPEGRTPTAGEVAGRMLKEAATGSDRERAEVEETAAAVGAQTWHTPIPVECRPFPPGFAGPPKPMTAQERVIQDKVVGLLEMGTERKTIQAKVPGIKAEAIDSAEQELARRRQRSEDGRANGAAGQ
jgi:hypothetical protein